MSMVVKRVLEIQVAPKWNVNKGLYNGSIPKDTKEDLKWPVMIASSWPGFKPGISQMQVEHVTTIALSHELVSTDTQNETTKILTQLEQ